MPAPAKAEVDKAKKQKKKPEDMPKAGMGVLDLVTGKVESLQRVKSFRLAKDGGRFLAALLEKPEEKKSEEKAKTPVVKVDPDGLQSRIAEFPIAAASYRHIVSLGDKVYYQRGKEDEKGKLLFYDLEKRKETEVIEIDGYDVTRLPMYRRARLGIGYLPQEASIFRGLTAEENIRATAELVEPEPGLLEAAVEELLAEFGVTHVRNTPALALSGGERRRVEIARALATHPSYILLDEPLAGIDPIAVGEIRALVKHLKDRGVGVLITDHNVRDALEIIDRAYILHDGVVLKEGTPDDIVADRDVRRVYLGERFSL